MANLTSDSDSPFFTYPKIILCRLLGTSKLPKHEMFYFWNYWIRLNPKSDSDSLPFIYPKIRNFQFLYELKPSKSNMFYFWNIRFLIPKYDPRSDRLDYSESNDGSNVTFGRLEHEKMRLLFCQYSLNTLLKYTGSSHGCHFRYTGPIWVRPGGVPVPILKDHFDMSNTFGGGLVNSGGDG